MMVKVWALFLNKNWNAEFEFCCLICEEKERCEDYVFSSSKILANSSQAFLESYYP